MNKDNSNRSVSTGEIEKISKGATSPQKAPGPDVTWQNLKSLNYNSNAAIETVQSIEKEGKLPHFL